MTRSVRITSAAIDVFVMAFLASFTCRVGAEVWAFLHHAVAMNYVILSLYFLTMIRWGADGAWYNAMYWAGAFWITLAVTLGYQSNGG